MSNFQAELQPAPVEYHAIRFSIDLSLRRCAIVESLKSNRAAMSRFLLALAIAPKKLPAAMDAAENQEVKPPATKRKK